MILNKFTTEFTRFGQVWTQETVNGSLIDKSVEAEMGTFNGYRQQASPEYLQYVSQTLSKPHIIWCPVDTDVAEGETLESVFGVDKVRAIQVNRDGRNPHKELLVEHIGFESTS